MKRICIYITTVCSIFLIGCAKDKTNDKLPGLSSLTVVNARPDLSAGLLNFSGGTISQARNKAAAYYQGFFEFPLRAGNLPVTIVSADDTLHAVFQGNLALKNTGIYSLYLFGNADNPQSLFLEDYIPAHRDSVSGIRFINLSGDSSPVNIVIEGSGAPVFSSLGFKQLSKFKGYPVTMDVTNGGGYTFDILDSSGNFLTSVYWSYSLFQNNTMVISGSSADGSLAVFQVNNY